MHRLILVAAVLASACTKQEMARELPSSTASTASGPPTSDLPCEVANLLAAHCWTCHGKYPVDESPMSLLTYADLLSPSVTEPEVSMAQESLARMTGSYMPMPPPPSAAIPPDELAAFQGWVDAGMHGGSCAVIDPFASEPVCTSGTFWDGGDEESPRMHPGLACLDCHTKDRGPRYALAGTVFPSAHEPDDCNGAGSVKVEIIGADGKSITMTANSAGNFYSKNTVTFPYTARITKDGRERVMATPADSGDCNACHTQAGDEAAPGRILAP
jgi:hypothetical protein